MFELEHPYYTKTKLVLGSIHNNNFVVENKHNSIVSYLEGSLPREWGGTEWKEKYLLLSRPAGNNCTASYFKQMFSHRITREDGLLTSADKQGLRSGFCANQSSFCASNSLILAFMDIVFCTHAKTCLGVLEPVRSPHQSHTAYRGPSSVKGTKKL